jgi:hypothetical protein
MLRNYKKLFIILFLFVILGLSAWFVAFAYATRWLEEKIHIARENLEQRGYGLTYSSLKVSGTPFSLQATLKNPHIKDSHGVMEWQGEEIKVTLRPWEYTTLYCDFLGKHELIVPKLSSLSLGTLEVRGAQGVIQLTSYGPQSFNLTMDQLSFPFEKMPEALLFKNVSLNVTHIRDPLNLKMSISTQLLNIEKFLKREARSQLFTLNFVADLSGFKPSFPFPKSLAEWRDGGGVVEVRLLKINWPPILAEIEGTLTLDAEMYPLGSFSSQISGYEEVLNTMVTLGWVKKKKATLALFMLDLFSTKDESGEKHLKAPITLQNKMLSVGPAPLLKLKPLIAN